MYKSLKTIFSLFVDGGQILFWKKISLLKYLTIIVISLWFALFPPLSKNKNKLLWVETWFSCLSLSERNDSNYL